MLAALLVAAEQQGAPIEDFAAVVDLPSGCLDVVLSKPRRP
ncbi:hypothetical protein [Streptomyces sp. NPDC004629]